jgi:hypothetical protein
MHDIKAEVLGAWHGIGWAWDKLGMGEAGAENHEDPEGPHDILATSLHFRF